MKVNNMDVAGLIRRMRRFRFETVKSASSALAAMSVADFTRAKSYLVALETYCNHVVGQPQLDLPEWAPKDLDLGEADKLDFAENEAIVDLMIMYDAMEVEVANSQSARMATGLISHDEKRFRDILVKMHAFLDNYVLPIKPLDLPESAPARAQTGPGRVGV